MKPMSNEAPWFRELFDEVALDAPDQTFSKILKPWLPKAREAISELTSHRDYEAAPPGSVSDEALWQWYALARVNDYLLLGFSPKRGVEPRRWRDTADHLVLGDFDVVTPDEYLEFFCALGFSPFTGTQFSPIHHEIVKVIEDERAGDTVIIERVFWPGLKFGELIFSRAGICVRAARQVINKQIAEHSVLYWSSWRNHREVDDLSKGWGHNSQWRTQFRRDYETATHLRFNVDGKYLLGAGEIPKTVEDDLAEYERIELLTHRCFVQCAKPSADRWPWDDAYAIAKATRYEGPM
jgi:hypothetical protein